MAIFQKLRRTGAALLLLCLLPGCLGGGTVPEPAPPPVEEEAPVPAPVEDGLRLPPAEYREAEGEAAVYATKEELVEAYLATQYEAYLALEHRDLSPFLDLSRTRNQNVLVWFDSLIQRRRLLEGAGLCYVERERFDYRVEYTAEVDDVRMDIWEKQRWPGVEILHFRVRGDADKAYPPFLAVNSLHSMWLTQNAAGGWQIDYHYYCGVTRRFLHFQPISVAEPARELEALQAEFAPAEHRINYGAVPPGAAPYRRREAVEYALAHTASRNPEFYAISDWTGNCANFCSQVMWRGFTDTGTNGTGSWNTAGGGSLAWVNVDYQWDWAMAGGMLLEEVSGIEGLRAGGMLQTRTQWAPLAEGYQHSLILVDEERLVFAQNSPDSLVYFSDLAREEMRFFNPQYLA